MHDENHIQCGVVSENKRSNSAYIADKRTTYLWVNAGYILRTYLLNLSFVSLDSILFGFVPVEENTVKLNVRCRIICNFEIIRSCYAG